MYLYIVAIIICSDNSFVLIMHFVGTRSFVVVSRFFIYFSFLSGGLP